MNKVKFGSQLIPIWSSLVKTEKDVRCCARTAEAQTAATINGISFDGFGHLTINPDNFSVTDQSHISIKFRTFSSFGVILLVDKPRTIEYYGLFLLNGYVMFEYGSAVNKVRLQSTKTYSDGKWYEV